MNELSRNSCSLRNAFQLLHILSLMSVCIFSLFSHENRARSWTVWWPQAGMIYLALCGAPWLDPFSAGCVPVADHHIMEWMGAIVQDDKVTRKASFSCRNWWHIADISGTNVLGWGHAFKVLFTLNLVLFADFPILEVERQWHNEKYHRLE